MKVNKLPHIEKLRNIFPNLSREVLQEILTYTEVKSLEPGEFLIRQGTEGTAYYFLIKGRLRAIQEVDEHKNILGDVAVGEPVGEMSFFTQSPRMASVLAVRKSEVLVIAKKSYERIVEHHPELAAFTNKIVIERLLSNELARNKLSAPKNIAVLNLNPGEDLSGWTDDMKVYFESKSIQLNVYDEGLPKDVDLGDYFESLEDNEGVNLLVIDEADTEHSMNCCVYADLIVIASKFDSDPKIREAEQQLNLYQTGVLRKRVFLLLLHEENAKRPRHTDKWFADRTIELHIHVRKNHQGDIGRFCRIVTHQAVGLVLGGGGAKGYAHIGVVKAMIQKGIPIDFIGGTSAGALYGVTMAYCDFDIAEVERICEESIKQKITSNDISVPVLSIMSGKKLTRFIKELFGKSGIEDLWTTSFCVSTNYSKAQMAVHQRGELWRRLRASISIPGIFPPVVIDRYLHVDGAVMDNLPIEPMYRYPVSEIYAISLSGLVERKTNYTDAPSSGRLIASKLFSKRKYKIPGLASIIINSFSLSSAQKQAETKNKVSHYLELDLKGVNFLANKKWRSIMQKGHEQAIEFLNRSED